jgi:hypothetical protein
MLISSVGNNTFSELIFDDKFITEPRNIADTLTNHFKFIVLILLQLKFYCGLGLQSVPLMSAGL